MFVLMEFDDGLSIWYETDGISVCHDPYGITGQAHDIIPGAGVRPAGDYVVIRNAKLSRMALPVTGGGTP